jgi:hypothetical protein
VSIFQYSNSNSSSVLYHNDKDPIYKSDWLRFMHVMENDIDSGVWIRTQGNNSITSAVLGHGFQHYDLGFGNNTHEDLGNIIALNNIEVSGMNGNDGYLTHETASIGIIGATANNGKGIAGISHNVKTIGIQAYGAKKNSNNIYEPFTIESACKGNGKYLKDLWKWEWGCDSTVDSMYLAKKNNAKTIIIEGTTSSPFEQPANELRAVIPYFVNSGINVIIPAANNYNKDIRKFNTTTWYGSPITVDMPDTGSVIVSGLSLDGSKRHIGSDNVYYNYGVSKAGGTNNLYTSGGHGVDVGGPAEESFTTWVYKNNLSATNNYDRFGGTSGASPAITAIINLMLSLNSSLTPYEIRKILRETRQDNLLLGNDKITGSTPTAGMVDAWKALNAVSPFTTTAGNPSSSYGYKIQGTTLDSSNVITNNSQIPVNITTEPNKVLGLSISGSSDGATVRIGSKNANILGYAPNTIGFTVPSDSQSGLQDVIVTTPNGAFTFTNAINIINNNADPSFPSSITTNNISKNINYGFNFDLNESEGIFIADKSGKNNNGFFNTLHDLFPLRVNNNTALNFQPGSFVTVPYNASYNLGRKFAFLATLKLHELNREQMILHKWEDGYVNGQLVQSYGLGIYPDNKITLTLADNKENYFSITHNANLTLELNQDIGIGVIVDLDAKTVKFIKNQTVVDGNIVYDGIGYHYNSLDQFDAVKNSTIPLAIGNYTATMQGDFSLITNLNADLSNVASIVEEIKPEEVTKIFYDMGLRD